MAKLSLLDTETQFMQNKSLYNMKLYLEAKLERLKDTLIESAPENTRWYQGAAMEVRGLLHTINS